MDKKQPLRFFSHLLTFAVAIITSSRSKVEKPEKKVRPRVTCGRLGSGLLLNPQENPKHGSVSWSNNSMLFDQIITNYIELP
jgi:hypothetical protein